MPTLLGVSKVRLKVPSLSPMKASWRQQKTRWLVGWVGFLLFDGNLKSGEIHQLRLIEVKVVEIYRYVPTVFFNTIPSGRCFGISEASTVSPYEVNPESGKCFDNFLKIEGWSLVKIVPCIWNGFAGELFPLPKPHVPRIKADIGLMGVFSVVGIHRTEYIRWHDMLDGYPP